MAKSRPARKKPARTSVPSTARAPKRSTNGVRTARPARRGTRRPRPAPRPTTVAETGGIPLRTRARFEVLRMAEDLGLKLPLSPRVLRHAIDKRERLLRAAPPAVETHDGVRGTVDPSPSLDALKDVARGTGPMEGVHESLRGVLAREDAEQLSQPRPYTGGAMAAPTPLGNGAGTAPSPMSQMIQLLDARVSRAFGVTQRLEARLVPISADAPPHGASAGGPQDARASNVVSVIEQIAAKVNGLGDFIETMTDRLLV